MIIVMMMRVMVMVIVMVMVMVFVISYLKVLTMWVVISPYEIMETFNTEVSMIQFEFTAWSSQPFGRQSRQSITHPPHGIRVSSGPLDV